MKPTFIAQHHHHLGSLLDRWVQSIFFPNYDVFKSKITIISWYEKTQKYSCKKWDIFLGFDTNEMSIVNYWQSIVIKICMCRRKTSLVNCAELTHECARSSFMNAHAALSRHCITCNWSVTTLIEIRSTFH